MWVPPMGERSPVAIVVDSAASLPEDMPRLPQMYVAPMRVTLGDRTYTDGRELRPTDFYRILRESSVLPSTSAPSPEGFLEAFRGAAGEARSVLCLTVGSQFSVSLRFC